MPKHLKKYNMKTTIITLLLTVTCCLSLNSANKTLNVYKLATAPVVDGNLSEWGSGWIDVAQIKSGNTTTGCTAQFQIGYTNDSVYIAVKVQDATPHNEPTISQPYLRDCVWIFLHLDTTTITGLNGSASYRLQRDGSMFEGSRFVGHNVKSISDMLNYTQEWAVSWKDVATIESFTFTNIDIVKYIRFDIMVSDNTTGTAARTEQLFWNSITDTQYYGTYDMGFLKLLNPFTTASTISVTGITSYIYNGSSQGPATSTSTGSVGIVTYTYSGTGLTTYIATTTRPTNVGTYQVIASVAADENYSAAISSPLTFTISAASSTIIVTGAFNYVSNGSMQGPVTSNVTGSTGIVTYLYSGTGLTTYAETNTRPANIGTYQVIASVAADENYSAATSSPFTFNILAEASPSTIIVTGAPNYTYNGSAQGPATSIVTGSAGAVTYSYMGTGSTTYGPSTTCPTNVGTYQVISSVAADANFSAATSSPFTFSISAASSTITVTGTHIYIFNGLVQGPISSTVIGSNGVVTYIYSGTGSTIYSPTTTRPTNVGTYQVIVSVAADANYSAATSSPFMFSIEMYHDVKVPEINSMIAYSVNRNLIVSGVNSYSVFNISGVKVAESAQNEINITNKTVTLIPGAYIVKSGKNVQKVIIK